MNKLGLVFLIALALAGVLLSGCAASSPKAMPLGDGVEWRLVVIGDSTLFGLADEYARQIEKDTGVKVVVDDYASPALKVSSVLEALKTGKSENSRLEKLPESVKNADVIVFFANPLGSIKPESPLLMDRCFEGGPPDSCPVEAYEQYSTDLKAVWAELVRLRRGKPTIFRAVDIYYPLVGMAKENGALEACTDCWEKMNDVVRQAAEAYSIPFLSRYSEFNGPDHMQDPHEKGYFLDDGVHPTDVDNQVTAGLLGKMGYEPVNPVKK